MLHARFDRLRPALGCVVAFVLTAIGIAGSLRGGSIFDDDFQPPPEKPRATPPLTPAPSPAPAPPTPKTPSAPAPTPASKPKIPAPAPPPDPVPPSVPDAPASNARREIPSKEERAKSRSMLKDVYKQELTDRSQAARKALADKFLEDAQKSSSQASDEFVLLTGALQAAQEASDLPLAFQAADSMAKDFPIDATTVKTQALLKMPLRQYASNREENQRVAIELMEELDKSGDFAQADKVGALLQQMAGTDLDRARLERRVKTIHEKAVAAKRLGGSLQILSTSPEDPAANAVAGRYYCFMEDNWDRGLPMLAKGSEPSMKSLAIKDIAATQSSGGAGADAPVAQAVGDAWWAASEREATPSSKFAMQRRAGFWYQQALPALSGLAKVKIERRVESISQPASDKTATSNTAESDSVLNEMLGQYPEAMKVAPDLELDHFRDGVGLSGAGGTFVENVPGSHSQIPRITDPDFDVAGPITSKAEPLSAGKYLVVFRIQGFTTRYSFIGNNVSTVEVLHGAGNSLAACHLRGADFREHQWLAVPVSIDLKKDDTIQYRFWPNGHAVAVDRMYVFKVK